MKSYKIITQSAGAEFTEKKSEFISVIAPVKSEKEALDFIENIRAGHKKARHNCYAYIIREGDIVRYSDDGEPGGTAGMPILEVLRSNGLCEAVCVVTRYFGGILLGAGGLTRAYSKSAADAVKKAGITEMKPAQVVLIKAEYTYYNRILAVTAQFGGYCENESFSDNVEVEAVLLPEIADEYKKKLIDVCNGVVFVEDSRKCYSDFTKNQHCS